MKRTGEIKRAVVLVLDSFGIGSTRDAERFGDQGANTLGHIAQYCAKERVNNGRVAPLTLPTLSSLGLMHAAKNCCGTFPAKVRTERPIVGAYGYAEEISFGKDTSSGHWEMMGAPVLFDWGYFSKGANSFPEAFLEEFINKAEIPGVLGNCKASGTEIIAKLGEEHISSGKPIVYTSADSVFQIACHEQCFGLDKLLHISQIAYELLRPYNICRVIARPFVGATAQDFKRTGNRRDFSVPPPNETLLDKLTQAGGEVLAVGKISDIFAERGVTRKIKASGLRELFDLTLSTLEAAGEQSLVFTNFVDFDSEYGHRRDPAGYACALEHFDRRLPELLSQLKEGDVLIITADHGCDPTWPGSDHTREHVPVLVYGHSVNPGSLGLCSTFADIGQSLASHFNLPALDYGRSFL